MGVYGILVSEQELGTTDKRRIYHPNFPRHVQLQPRSTVRRATRLNYHVRNITWGTRDPVGSVLIHGDTRSIVLWGSKASRQRKGRGSGEHDLRTRNGGQGSCNVCK